jgi:iron complex outermembrane recepter protein
MREGYRAIQEARFILRQPSDWVAIAFSWLCYAICLPVCGQDANVGASLNSLPDNGVQAVEQDHSATASDLPSSEPSPPSPEADLDALLDMAEKDPAQLQSVQVQSSNSSAISQSNIAETDFDPSQSTSAASSASTGELLSRAPSVITRRTSAVNQDVRIRGFSGSQIVGVASGMNQAKARLDIDSLFSQIDPTLIDNIAVIAGPYSVEYGPGFAFFDARLIEPERSSVPVFKSRSLLGYNINGQQFSTRETMMFSNQNGGIIASIGQRAGNDYRAGSDFGSLRIPASYDVYDVFTSVSRDIGDHSRFDAWYLHQGMQNVELPGVVYDINDQNSDQLNLRWTLKDDSKNDFWRNQLWWNHLQR